MVNLSLTGGPVTASTTPATVFTNTTGLATRVLSVTVAQGSSAVAKTVRISIGTDGATTRVLELALAAGVGESQRFPGWVLTGTQTLQLSATAGNNEAVVTINGQKDSA
jgi:uncharacterized protein YcnI